MPIMLIVIIGLFGLSLAMFGMSRNRKAVISIDDRLATFAERPASLEEQEMSQPFSDRVLRPFVKQWSVRLGERSPSKSADKMRLKLAQAGNPSAMGPAEFVGFR